VGGSDNSYNEYDYIYSTTDGSVWTKEIEHNAIGPVRDMSMVTFKDKIIIAGGMTRGRRISKPTIHLTNNFSDKVFQSADGVAYSNVASAQFSPRAGSQLVIKGDEL